MVQDMHLFANCLVSGVSQEWQTRSRLRNFLRLQELGLLKGDAPSRLWLQYKEFTWVCGCAVLLVGPEVVCSPVVLRDLGGTLREKGRGRWIPSQTQLTLREEWLYGCNFIALLFAAFLCFGLPEGGSAVNIYRLDG